MLPNYPQKNGLWWTWCHLQIFTCEVSTVEDSCRLIHSDWYFCSSTNLNDACETVVQKDDSWLMSDLAARPTSLTQCSFVLYSGLRRLFIFIGILWEKLYSM